MSAKRRQIPLAGAGLDRRAEIGRERRDKTRQFLLLSAAKLVAVRGTDNVSIDDFVKAAGVARGTFYNYFQTWDEVITELWQLFGNGPFLSISRANVHEPDPAHRLTRGFRWVVQKAARDHTWGWWLSRITTSGPEFNQEMRSFPLADIRAGIDSGRFKAQDPETVCDYFIGFGFAAIKAVMTTHRAPDYPEQCAFLILRGLGLKVRDAREVAGCPLPDISL